MCIGFHVKYPSCLSDFNSAWTFRTHFQKILKYQISYKSVEWEPSCSFRTYGWTDGQTDRRDEANSLFAILPTRLKSNMSLLWRDMPWSVSYLFRKLPLQNLFKSRLWLTVTATTSCTAVTTAPRIELDTRTCW